MSSCEQNSSPTAWTDKTGGKPLRNCAYGEKSEGSPSLAVTFRKYPSSDFESGSAHAPLTIAAAGRGNRDTSPLPSPAGAAPRVTNNNASDAPDENPATPMRSGSIPSSPAWSRTYWYAELESPN